MDYALYELEEWLYYSSSWRYRDLDFTDENVGLPSAHKLLNSWEGEKKPVTKLEQSLFELSASSGPLKLDKHGRTLPQRIIASKMPAGLLHACITVGCDFHKKNSKGQSVLDFFREVPSGNLKREYEEVLFQNSQVVSFLRVPDSENRLKVALPGFRKCYFWTGSCSCPVKDTSEHNLNSLHSFTEEMTRMEDPKMRISSLVLIPKLSDQLAVFQDDLSRLKKTLETILEMRHPLDRVLWFSLNFPRNNAREADFMVFQHDHDKKRCSNAYFHLSSGDQHQDINGTNLAVMKNVKTDMLLLLLEGIQSSQGHFDPMKLPEPGNLEVISLLEEGNLQNFIKGSFEENLDSGCSCQEACYILLHKLFSFTLPETYVQSEIIGADTGTGISVQVLLTEEQQQCLQCLHQLNTVERQHSRIAVIAGKQGSGKTTLALAFLEGILKQGQEFQVILPENQATLERQYRALIQFFKGNSQDFITLKNEDEELLNNLTSNLIIMDGFHSLEALNAHQSHGSQLLIVCSEVEEKNNMQDVVWISLGNTTLPAGDVDSQMETSSVEKKVSTVVDLPKTIKLLLTRVVLAIDGSGSTDKFPRYWERVDMVLKRVLTENDVAPILLLWNTSATEVTQKALETVIQNQRGDGSTNMSSVSKFLAGDDVFGSHEEIKRSVKFYLCTDGQIDEDEVDRTDTILGGKPFQTAEIYIESPSNVNISVAAPFLRKSNYQVMVNGEIVLQGSSLSSLNLPEINTFEEFEARKDEIWAQVYPKLGGNKASDADSNTLRSWATETKRKVLKHLSQEQSKKNKDVNRILKLLQERKEENVLSIIGEERSLSDPTPGQLVESAFAPFFNISKKRDFSLQAYKNFPNQVVEKKTDVGNVDEGLLWGDFSGVPDDLQPVCDITGNLDIGVLMLRTFGDLSTNIFLDLSPRTSERLAQQPLFVLKTEEARDRLLGMIDHPIGLTAFLEWVNKNGHNTSPYTRQTLAGCMPFSNHPSIVTYTNKFTCHLLWGGKLVGIPVMWQWVFFFLIKDHPSMEYMRKNHSEFVASMEKVLVKRTNDEVTRLGMSGLGDFPMELVPVSVACWYVARGSSLIYAEDSAARSQERLIQFRSLARELATIVNLCGIPIEVEAVVERATHLRLLEVLFGLVKSKSWYADKLLGAMKYERFDLDTDKNSEFSSTTDEKRFVLWDRSLPEGTRVANDLRLPQVLKESGYETGLAILSFLRKKKDGKELRYNKYTGVPLPMKIKPVSEVESNHKKYGYSLENDTYVYADSPVCPGTMRCYINDVNTGKPWREMAETKMGPLEKQVSAYKQYQKAFVRLFKQMKEEEKNSSSGRFPSMKDVFVEIEKSQVSKGFLLLPRDFDKAVKDVLKDYERAREEYARVKNVEMSPRLFHDLLSDSTTLVRREEIETQWRAMEKTWKERK